MSLDVIGVLAELERLGVKYEYADENNVRILCPFHDETRASCSVHLHDRGFNCHSCGAKGDIVKLLGKIVGVTRAHTIADLSTRYDFAETKTIDPDLVERYHSQIWSATALVHELAIRGIDHRLIRQHRIGECKGRITIPIPNEIGLYVNIRRYLPGAPRGDKVKNTRTYGKIRLFPIDQLKFEDIVLVGGECKAMLGAAVLNPHNIGCITATCGENNWNHELTEQLRGHNVWVCYDIDEAGRRATTTRLRQLAPVSISVYDMLLPLNEDQYPSGDINDFVATEKGDLLEVVRSSEEWKPSESIVSVGDYAEARPVSLSGAVNAELANTRVATSGLIAAADTTPYALPRKVLVDCSRNEEYCGVCPIFAQGEPKPIEIHPESTDLVDMMGVSARAQRALMMQGLGIPVKCKSCKFNVRTHWHVEDVRLSPSLDISNRDTEKNMVPAVFVGAPAVLNSSFEVEGRVVPNPKNQQCLLVVSKSKPVRDSLEHFKPKPAQLEALQVFRPTAWTVEAIEQKLSNLYEDLAANVTKIWQRPDLHLMVDLSYHSPLLIPHAGKGWTEVLVVGDSAQGKSQVSERLMRHYNAGTRIECKNATVAGLLGGVQKLDGRFFVTWGIVPRNDKRHVILEELKGAPVEVISKLTDMRSSGIAEIPKIEARRTHARTRMLVNSNPRSNRPMSSYTYGCQALLELIGNPEDLRRFDACYIVAAGDVPRDVSTHEAPIVEHRHTSDLCSMLVTWAWTRPEQKVVIPDTTLKEALAATRVLTETYTDNVPIVDRGSMLHKLLRLSSALACRLFCTDESMLRVVVLPCHVEFITQLLTRIYNSHSFGYDGLTRAVRSVETLRDEHELKEAIVKAPFPEDLLEGLLTRDFLEHADLEDWCDWDRIEARRFVSLFVRKGGLVRVKRAYRKTPAGIRFLKNVELPKRPEHIEEKF